MTREYARTLTAHHESGHAVLAVALGLPVEFVSIVPSPTSGGRCHLAAPIGQFDPGPVAVWILGGPEAERAFTRAPRARGADGDYQFVRDLLTATKRADEDMDTLAGRYELLARAKVLLYERWITRVAGALLRHDHLLGEDVLALRV